MPNISLVDPVAFPTHRAIWRGRYVRSGGNLTYAMIRAAGHIAPYDQPERTLDMITRFIERKPFPSFPDPQQPGRSV